MSADEGGNSTDGLKGLVGLRRFGETVEIAGKVSVDFASTHDLEEIQ